MFNNLFQFKFVTFWLKLSFCIFFNFNLSQYKSHKNNFPNLDLQIFQNFHSQKTFLSHKKFTRSSTKNSLRMNLNWIFSPSHFACENYAIPAHYGTSLVSHYFYQTTRAIKKRASILQRKNSSKIHKDLKMNFISIFFGKGERSNAETVNIMKCG
jgi:hypothetical protein